MQYYAYARHATAHRAGAHCPGTGGDVCADAAHPARLRMVQRLLYSRYAVGELATACEMPSHMASEHLRQQRKRVRWILSA
jgi:hypothetical protein